MILDLRHSQYSFHTVLKKRNNATLCSMSQKGLCYDSINDRRAHCISTKKTHVAVLTLGADFVSKSCGLITQWDDQV